MSTQRPRVNNALNGRKSARVRCVVVPLAVTGETFVLAYRNWRTSEILYV